MHSTSPCLVSLIHPCIWSSKAIHTLPTAMTERTWTAYILYGLFYPQPGPGQPSVNIVTTTATFISLSWSVPSGAVVTSYEVIWQRDTSVGCSDEDEGSSTISTDRTTINYDISGLVEDSLYRITVTAVNSIASIVSETVTVITEEAGRR